MARARLAAISDRAPESRRGETSSSFYACLYVMLAIPVIAVGGLAQFIDLRHAGLVLSVAMGLLALGVWISLIWGDNAPGRLPRERN